MTTSKNPRESSETRKTRAQLEQLQTAIKNLSRLAGELSLQKKNLDLLQSVGKGLYEEIDKLAKKSPADEISLLGLEHVNDLIRESKDLAPDDLYMQRCKVFVAAGDNPQHRDVVLVVRQVRQGLERFDSSLSQRTKQTRLLLGDAEGLKIALMLVLKGHHSPTAEDLEENKVGVSTYWIKWEIGTSRVNLRLLDRTNIPIYFAEPE